MFIKKNGPFRIMILLNRRPEASPIFSQNRFLILKYRNKSVHRLVQQSNESDRFMQKNNTN